MVFMLALTVQVGMLIGRPGNRDTFLLLLPTPHEVCKSYFSRMLKEPI